MCEYTVSPSPPPPPVAASSGLDGYIKVWNLTSGEQLKSMDGGPVDVWTVAFSPDSQVLVELKAMCVCRRREEVTT